MSLVPKKPCAPPLRFRLPGTELSLNVLDRLFLRLQLTFQLRIFHTAQNIFESRPRPITHLLEVLARKQPRRLYLFRRRLRQYPTDLLISVQAGMARKAVQPM